MVFVTVRHAFVTLNQMNHACEPQLPHLVTFCGKLCCIFRLFFTAAVAQQASANKHS
jgi:hypothetical protein